MTNQQKQLISALGVTESVIVEKYNRLVSEGLAIKDFTQYLKNMLMLSELQKSNKLSIIVVDK